MEAFISRISAEGPSAKRPPHMLLELPLRLVIASLLSLSAGFALAGCDRQKAAESQGGPSESAGQSPAGKGSYAAGTIDRSQSGTQAPTVSFEDAMGRSVSLAAFR
jgi:hypothetical protein